MTENENAIAYRCPACSEAVFGTVSAFGKGSGKVKLKCSCGESMLEANIAENGKIRFVVPCLFCPAPHFYQVDKDALFSGKFFTLSCPQTALPAVFVGPASTVSAAVEENEKEIRRIASEAGIDLDDKPQAVDTNAIKEQLLRLLGMLKAEGRIICDCEDKDKNALTVTVTEDGVEIKCRDCKASRFFRGLTTLDCEYLADIDLLYLE